MDNKLEQIERIKQLRKAENKITSEKLKQTGKIQNDLYVKQAKPEKEETLLGEKYKQSHIYDTYFKLEHVTDIGLPFDVALILTKRGTGKTYNYMKKILDVALKGEQFAIVRNTKQELDGGVKEHIYSIGEFKIKQNKVYGKADDNGEPIGYLAHLNGESQPGQGAGYEKLTTIIGDEATNAGLTTKKTAKGIMNFGQLTSTFFRNRIGGKVWIFGNLMKDVEGKISSTLLDSLGIDTDSRLKYIINETPQGHKYRLIYINTGNLYKGSGEHLMSNIGISQEKRDDLSSNLPSKIGDCVVANHYFINAKEKMWGILTRFDSKQGMILIAKEPYIQLDDPIEKQAYERGDIHQYDKHFYIIRCEELKKSMIGFEMNLYTNEENLWNMYKDAGAVMVKKKEKWKKIGYRLAKMIRSGRATYIGDNTYYDLTRIMSGRKDEIQGYIDDKKKKVKEILSKGSSK